MTTQYKVINRFRDIYQQAPAYIIRAPGRVNLIGEHTDYNDGFVFPMAINRAVWIALKPRHDEQIVVDALDFDEQVRFNLNDLTNTEADTPAEYIKGVAWALQQAGFNLKGWQGTLKGNIPIGAGLSSSAALEMAVMQTFAAVSGFQWDAPKMAKLGQKVENEWIGVNSGIMDQMISAAGRAGSVMLIDCRSLDTELVPLPSEVVIVILDTSTRRGLAGSAYNDRRASCEKAAAAFGVKALRDLSVSQLREGKARLDLLSLKRARHVVHENDRVLAARNALKIGDVAAFGQLMNTSHASLRDDFEISSDALNAIVSCAQSHPACYGARMTGGGFAGCAVALVKSNQADAFATYVEQCYIAETGLTPQIYITPPTNGAEVIST